MDYHINDLRTQQEELAKRVSLVNAVSSLPKIKTISAADISCGRFSTIGYAAVILFSYPDLEVLEQQSFAGELPIPYIPGYLSFREAPLIQHCLNQLSTKPQVMICDGQGIAHPRRCGIASYIGVMNDFVSVGCGKSRLIGEYEEPGSAKGNRSCLFHKGDKIGEVVRTRNNVKPLFISPGHNIDFTLSTELILSLCKKYRQPEPIRAVHNLVNEIRKKSKC